MEIGYSFQIPDNSGMSVRYYLQNKSQMDEARSFPPHVHDRYEFYVLIEGDASFMVENRLYTLRPGDVVFSRPNEIHNCVLNSDSVHKHFCIWFDADQGSLLSGSLFGEGDYVSHISPSAENRERLCRICEELDLAGETGRTLRQFYLSLEFLDLLRENRSVESARVELPSQLTEILDDINRNFAGIKDLCYFTERYYVSPSTLNRMFRRYLKTSPAHYLETKRLAFARTLLRQGKSVSEAGARAGFSNGSNFIRLFKKRFHMTPAEYKSGKEVKDTDVVIH